MVVDKFQYLKISNANFRGLFTPLYTFSTKFIHNHGPSNESHTDKPKNPKPKTVDFLSSKGDCLLQCYYSAFMASVPISGGLKPPDLSQNNPIDAEHPTQLISLQKCSPVAAIPEKPDATTVAPTRLGSSDNHQVKTGSIMKIQINGDDTQGQE